MLNTLLTVIYSTEKIHLALLCLQVVVIARSTAVTPTPDPTLDADFAVCFLAYSVFALTRPSIELVSLEALVADRRSPQAAILAEVNLTDCASALARDCIESEALVAGVADSGPSRRTVGTLLDKALLLVKTHGTVCRPDCLLKVKAIHACIATFRSTSLTFGTVAHDAFKADRACPIVDGSLSFFALLGLRESENKHQNEDTVE